MSMMTYQYIFIDLDDTIFDFQKSEQKAFKKLTEHIGFPYSDDLFNQFKQYNQQLWHQIELGTLSKSELLATRFPNFFEQFGFSVVSDNMDDYFRDQLAEAGDLIDGAENFLITLQQHQKTLLAASNGVYPTQIKRLNQTGIIGYFDYIFISEKLGFSKPDTRFFEESFKQINDFDFEQAIMIGDSLTSDMRGAHNIQMHSIWYNPHQKQQPDDLTITYQAQNFKEILDILI